MLIPLKYNLRSLRVRRVTTLVTAVGIGLTVTVFVAVMGLVEGMRNTFVSTGVPLNLLVIRQGSLTETSSILEREPTDVIRTLEGIATDAQGRARVSVERIVFINQPRRTGGTSNVVLRGLDEVGRELRPQVKLVEGRWYQPGLRELTVSRAIAERFVDCGLGEHLGTGRAQWTVVGIFDAGPTAYGSEIWTDVNDLGNAFERFSYASVLLRTRDPQTLTVLSERISSDRRLQLKATPETEYFAEQTQAASPIKVLGNIIAVIMAVGSAFAAMNTMYAAVGARIREVAVLRVLGFSPRSILLSFLVESLILASLGGVIGILLALPLNGLATGTTNWFSFSEMTFQFRITPALLLQGLGFAAVMGVAGGLLPALRASRQRPAVALRAL